MALLGIMAIQDKAHLSDDALVPAGGNREGRLQANLSRLRYSLAQAVPEMQRSVSQWVADAA
jgi:hypothetical protein